MHYETLKMILISLSAISWLPCIHANILPAPKPQAYKLTHVATIKAANVGNDQLAKSVSNIFNQVKPLKKIGNNMVLLEKTPVNGGKSTIVMTDKEGINRVYFNDENQVSRLQYQNKGNKIAVMNGKNKHIKDIIIEKDNVWKHPAENKETHLLVNDKDGIKMLLLNQQESKEGLFTVKWVQDKDGNRFKLSSDAKTTQAKTREEWGQFMKDDLPNMIASSTKNELSKGSKTYESKLHQLEGNLYKFAHNYMKKLSARHPKNSILHVLNSVALVAMVTLISAMFIHLHQIQAAVQEKFDHYSTEIPKVMNEKFDQVFPKQVASDFINNAPEIQEIRNRLSQWF